MKKICLVFLLILLTFSFNAFAKSEYIRIECNETLGMFDISYHQSVSPKLEQYFQLNPNKVYMYDISDTSHKTEIFFVNSNQIFKIRKKEPFSLQYQLDFKYTCNLKNSYHLNISFNNYELKTDSASYNIMIKKEFYDNTILNYITTTQIEDIIIGSDTHINHIIITEKDGSNNPEVSFETIDKISTNNYSSPLSKELNL